MTQVLRWSRTAYETEEGLGMEEAAARALGWGWALWEPREVAPDGACDVLVVTSKVRVTGSVMDALGCGLVLTTTSGVDHVDLHAARRRGVVVARCPIARRDPVVEYTLAALIDGMRRAGPLHEAARQGRWARADLPALGGRGLSGATVGVVGLGVIGERVAECLEALGASVLGVDPFASTARPRLALHEVLPRVDALTLHCQLTPSSRGLIGADALRALPSHAVVVNTSRGGVLDVAAAVAAVRRGDLRALCCDVFPQEPWPAMADAAHPEIRLTPHAAGFVADLGQRVAVEVGDALRAWGAGKSPPAVVKTPV